MDFAARVNALDDLLPHVTSLAEVQRALLRGLLRKVALADVEAIAGPARNDPHLFVGLKTNRFGPCSNQGEPKRGQVGRGNPDLKRWLRRVGTHDGDAGFA